MVFNIITIFISCLIIVGNTLTILAVTCDKRMRRDYASNYLIASLAVADLCVGLVDMPLAILYRSRTVMSFFEPIVCDTWMLFDFTVVISSIIHLMVISVDRYCQITKSLWYRANKSLFKTLVTISVIWFAALMFGTLGVSGNRYVATKPFDPSEPCGFRYSKYYALFIVIMSTYLPSMILFYIYYKLFSVAIKHRNSVKGGMKTVSASHASDGTQKENDQNLIVLRYHRGKVLSHTQSVEQFSMDSDDKRPPSRISPTPRKRSSHYKAAVTIGVSSRV